ncbi:MAG: type II secretion system F family protein [Verrucomicrobia bacterium]|nr:type II secretion system F family protein [Verrucomicrobiota bacterium]
MPKFTYTAMDAKGAEKKGALDADSQNGAITQLRELGLFPTNVVEVGGDKKQAKATKGEEKGSGKRSAAKSAGGKGLGTNINISALWGGSGVKAKVLTIFTRQLATLVDAGLPLLRGLSVLQRQERNPVLKNVIGDLATAVESGSTFSEALFQHPKIFSKLYINMVKAGEVGGVLEVVLNRLSQFMEKAEKIKGKIKAAMFYPMAVLIIAVGILSFLMIKIVPQFEAIFSEMLQGVPLPAFTVFVLGFSRRIKDNALLVVGLLIALIIAVKIIGKTTAGRIVIDRLKLHAPLFGDVIRKATIARFTRTLGTLVASGVPILQALLIVRETSGNRVIANAVSKIHDSVKEGESIVQPLDASGVFPPMVVSMIDVGETTGALPDMLMKIADNYEEEVDNAISAMVSLLEPIMIVFLALIVGSIVIALFLPLIKIITTLGQDASGGS